MNEFAVIAWVETSFQTNEWSTLLCGKSGEVGGALGVRSALVVVWATRLWTYGSKTGVLTRSICHPQVCHVCLSRRHRCGVEVGPIPVWRRRWCVCSRWKDGDAREGPEDRIVFGNQLV